METAPHPAESAPLVRPIEVFMEESAAEQVEVLNIPTTFDQAVGKFGREVSKEHENLLDLNAEHPPVEPRDRTMDVVTDTSTARKIGGFIGATVAAVTIATGNPIGDKVRESFDSAKTGKVAAEQDAKTDGWSQSIVVKSMQGYDGPVKVRVIKP